MRGPGWRIEETWDDPSRRGERAWPEPGHCSGPWRALLAAGWTLLLAAGLPAMASAELNALDNRRFASADPSSGDRYGAALAVGDFNCDGSPDLAIGVPAASVGMAAGAGQVEVRLSAMILVAPRAVGERGAPALYETLILEQPLVPGPEPGDGFGTTLAAGDIDGDLCDDLVVGVPLEDLGVEPAGQDNGGINIFYGHAVDPLTSANFLTQNTIGLASDGAQADDRFGSALAVGNFNGDDYDDIAVGVYLEDLPGASSAGAVHIIPGSAAGPDLDDDVFLTEGSGGYLGSPATGDQYGAALVAADFDGDDIDDLAIGAPGQEVTGVDGAGDVHVIYGTALGLSPADEQRFFQSGVLSTEGGPMAGVLGVPEMGDRFGAALAAADFDGSGEADLAVGVPGESVTVGMEVTTGSVSVLYGGPAGLSSLDDALLDASVSGFADLGGDFAGGDVFAPTALGGVLAAGDIDGDAFADLLFGLPAASHSQTDGPNSCTADAAVSWSQVGAVLVLHGSSTGVSLERNEGFVNWSDDGLDNGCMVPGERLGAALAVFDANRDGQGDLAVGIPFADPVDDVPGGKSFSAGEVVVVSSAIFASGFEPDPVAFAIDQDDDWDLPSVP